MFDGLCSVAGLTGADGTPLRRYVYDVWGKVIAQLPSNDAGVTNKFQFTGEALDPGSSMYYLRARYYDPETGRFLTKDEHFVYPLLPLTLNTYVYARNNPVRYIDRTGRWPSESDYSYDPYASASWPFSPPWP